MQAERPYRRLNEVESTNAAYILALYVPCYLTSFFIISPYSSNTGLSHTTQFTQFIQYRN